MGSLDIQFIHFIDDNNVHRTVFFYQRKKGKQEKSGVDFFA